MLYCSSLRCTSSMILPIRSSHACMLAHTQRRSLANRVTTPSQHRGVERGIETESLCEPSIRGREQITLRWTRGGARCVLRSATVSCAFDVGRCDDLGWQAANVQGRRKVGRTRHTVRGMRGCAARDKGRVADESGSGHGHREQRHVVDIARFRDQGESESIDSRQYPTTRPAHWPNQNGKIPALVLC